MSTLTISQAAVYLSRNVKTLQRWDREKILVAGRTATNRRYYTKNQLDLFLGRAATKIRRPVAYCRVSSAGQKPELTNQRKALEEFCIAKGLANVEFIEEIGGGLNFNRKKFVKLIADISSGTVSHLVIAHKDRLCRFAFEWFERVCAENDCELLILNAESLSPEEEMVQDLMTVIHCFSSRLYGLRNYKKKLKEALDANPQS